VQNAGWLPTDITRLARQKKMTRGVILELSTNAAITMVSGNARVQCGQLDGWNLKASSPNVWGGRPADPTDDRCKGEWLIAAPAGSTVTLCAHHERAGRISRTVELRTAPAAPDGNQ
jgi:hypothetical protein